MTTIVRSKSNSHSQQLDIITGASTSSTLQLEEIITEDGILCLILSFLTLREAVRTSVLSRRWRRLWPRLTKFDFNVVTVLDAQSLRGRHLDGEEAYNLTKGKTAKFIQSVDSVLQQLQGTKLDEFRVGHSFDKSDSHHLDAWLCFAVASKTKMLHMHLFKPYTKWYNFPCHLLGSSPFLQVIDLPKVSSKFAYLTHLDWDWTSGFKMSLFHLETMLDVAPSLKELNLWLSERVLEQPPRAPSKFREMLHKYPHCHLKTVRLRNFYFDTWQIEIAAYLLNKAIQLESMTIEKGRKPSSFASKAVFNRGKEILTQQVPQNVRLIIL